MYMALLDKCRKEAWITGIDDQVVCQFLEIARIKPRLAHFEEQLSQLFRELGTI